MPTYIWFALGACLCYAIENVLLDRYLKGISNNLLLAANGILPLIIGGIWLMRQKWDQPVEGLPINGTQVVVIVVCSVLTALAGWLFYGSYNHGGDAAKVTIIAITLPVFTGITKCVLDQSWPEPKNVAALLLVSIAIWLMSPSS